MGRLRWTLCEYRQVCLPVLEEVRLACGWLMFGVTWREAYGRPAGSCRLGDRFMKSGVLSVLKLTPCSKGFSYIHTVRISL